MTNRITRHRESLDKKERLWMHKRGYSKKMNRWCDYNLSVIRKRIKDHEEIYDKDGKKRVKA